MVNSLNNSFGKKWFWISYSNSNTFHVKIFVDSKILVNAFLIENVKIVNSLNNYFGKQKMFWITNSKFEHFSFRNFCQIQKILVNAFLVENVKMINSLKSYINYFRKQKMVLD